ncbi:hypothetical protein DIPPA_17806 [Diplonema papillatum]|nr:hypothetical protein DIPPA_17806 [Diplonema papillatum]
MLPEEAGEAMDVLSFLRARRLHSALGFPTLHDCGKTDTRKAALWAKVREGRRPKRAAKHPKRGAGAAAAASTPAAATQPAAESSDEDEQWVREIAQVTRPDSLPGAVRGIGLLAELPKELLGDSVRLACNLWTDPSRPKYLACGPGDGVDLVRLRPAPAFGSDDNTPPPCGGVSPAGVPVPCLMDNTPPFDSVDSTPPPRGVVSSTGVPCTMDNAPTFHNFNNAPRVVSSTGVPCTMDNTPAFDSFDNSPPPRGGVSLTGVPCTIVNAPPFDNFDHTPSPRGVVSPTGVPCTKDKSPACSSCAEGTRLSLGKDAPPAGPARGAEPGAAVCPLAAAAAAAAGGAAAAAGRPRAAEDCRTREPTRLPGCGAQPPCCQAAAGPRFVDEAPAWLVSQVRRAQRGVPDAAACFTLQHEGTGRLLAFENRAFAAVRDCAAARAAAGPCWFVIARSVSGRCILLPKAEKGVAMRGTPDGKVVSYTFRSGRAFSPWAEGLGGAVDDYLAPNAIEFAFERTEAAESTEPAEVALFSASMLTPAPFDLLRLPENDPPKAANPQPSVAAGLAQLHAARGLRVEPRQALRVSSRRPEEAGGGCAPFILEAAEHTPAGRGAGGKVGEAAAVLTGLHGDRWAVTCKGVAVTEHFGLRRLSQPPAGAGGKLAAPAYLPADVQPRELELESVCPAGAPQPKHAEAHDRKMSDFSTPASPPVSEAGLHRTQQQQQQQQQHPLSVWWSLYPVCRPSSGVPVQVFRADFPGGEGSEGAGGVGGPRYAFRTGRSAYVAAGAGDAVGVSHGLSRACFWTVRRAPAECHDALAQQQKRLVGCFPGGGMAAVHRHVESRTATALRFEAPRRCRTADPSSLRGGAAGSPAVRSRPPQPEAAAGDARAAAAVWSGPNPPTSPLSGGVSAGRVLPPLEEEARLHLPPGGGSRRGTPGGGGDFGEARPQPAAAGSDGRLLPARAATLRAAAWSESDTRRAPAGGPLPAVDERGAPLNPPPGGGDRIGLGSGGGDWGVRARRGEAARPRTAAQPSLSSSAGAGARPDGPPAEAFGRQRALEKADRWKSPSTGVRATDEAAAEAFGRQGALEKAGQRGAPFAGVRATDEAAAEAFGRQGEAGQRGAPSAGVCATEEAVEAGLKRRLAELLQRSQQRAAAVGYPASWAAGFRREDTAYWRLAAVPRVAVVLAAAAAIVAAEGTIKVLAELRVLQEREEALSVPLHASLSRQEPHVVFWKKAKLKCQPPLERLMQQQPNVAKFSEADRPGFGFVCLLEEGNAEGSISSKDS